MPLTFRTITGDAQIENYLVAFEEQIGIKLPLAYAKQGVVWGAYNAVGELKGGFILITQPNFRTFLMVPDEIKKQNKFFQEADTSDVFEVNGFWMAPELRKTYASMVFWLKMRKEALRTNRPYMMCMWNRSNEGLKRLYSNLDPTVIFEGQPRLVGIGPSHKEVIISYVSRRTIILGKYTKFSYYFFRMFRKKRSRSGVVAHPSPVLADSGNRTEA